jgi:hypothetical protein
MGDDQGHIPCFVSEEIGAWRLVDDVDRGVFSGICPIQKWGLQ